MTTQEVPALVLTLANKVNMTPIAWRIDPTSVTIVFEQGPKMTFERDQVPDQVPEAIEPVIHIKVATRSANMEEAAVFTRAATRKPPPRRKPRK